MRRTPGPTCLFVSICWLLVSAASAQAGLTISVLDPPGEPLPPGKAPATFLVEVRVDCTSLVLRGSTQGMDAGIEASVNGTTDHPALQLAGTPNVYLPPCSAGQEMQTGTVSWEVGSDLDIPAGGPYAVSLTGRLPDLPAGVDESAGSTTFEVTVGSRVSLQATAEQKLFVLAEAGQVRIPVLLTSTSNTDVLVTATLADVQHGDASWVTLPENVLVPLGDDFTGSTETEVIVDLPDGLEPGAMSFDFQFAPVATDGTQGATSRVSTILRIEQAENEGSPGVGFLPGILLVAGLAGWTRRRF